MENHECMFLKEVGKADRVGHKEFEKRHPNVYFPYVGLKVVYEKGEWILVVGKEYAVPIKSCPFCEQKLESIEVQSR